MPSSNSSPGAMLDGAQAHALALAMYNAVEAQQQGAIVRQAATTMVCTAMLSLGVAETAEGEPLPPPADTATDAAAPPPVAAALKEAVSKVAPPVSAVDPSKLAGKAYQSVAQSAALAIQDAADYLRNVTTIASTAMGVAVAQELANPGAASGYSKVMDATQAMVAAAIANFEAIGASAESVLKNFPET